MAKRDFNKVSPAIWTSRRFRGVGDKAKLHFLYLITNEHVDSGGCYRLPNAYACSDRGIDCEAQMAAVQELIEADMIAVDQVAEYTLIKRWFKHNPLMSPDHAEGTRRRIAVIESDALREEAEAAFIAAEVALKERLEHIEAARAERASKARLRLAHSQDNQGSSGFNSPGLANTRYLNGGGK